MRESKSKLLLVLVAGVVLVAVGVFAWGFTRWLLPLLRGIQELGE